MKKLKKGNWYYDFNLNKIKKALEVESDRIYYTRYHCTIPTKAKKIILTTDEDLIKDGVQAIDNEFLKWFINNPSCEEVKIESLIKWRSTTYDQPDVQNGYNYEIIIPKEEAKQETLEEAAEKYVIDESFLPVYKEECERSFKNGAKWQAERMYSEEEVRIMLSESFKASQEGYNITADEIIEQFKKKQDE